MTVLFMSQFIVGVGKASTKQKKDTVPPKNDVADVDEIIVVGGTNINIK